MNEYLLLMIDCLLFLIPLLIFLLVLTPILLMILASRFISLSCCPACAIDKAAEWYIYLFKRYILREKITWCDEGLFLKSLREEDERREKEGIKSLKIHKI